MRAKAVVVRNPDLRAATWLAWAMAAAVAVAASSRPSSSAVVPFLVFGTTLVLVFWRAGHCGVRVRPDGIRIVNFLSTREVPWEGLREFSVAPSTLDPEMPWAVLATGERIRLWGCRSIRTLVRDTAPGAQVAQLTEILENVRRTGVVAAGPRTDRPV